MKILTLDTATLTASVAIAFDGEIVGLKEALVSTHSEVLLALIDRVFTEVNLAPGDIDVIACGRGPGSFTGLRIGMATAKGLAFALGKPLVTVSSLLALAMEAHASRDALVLSLLDAKKSELYAGLYRADLDVMTPVRPETVLPPGALRDYVRGAEDVVIVGNGAAVYPEIVAPLGEVMTGRQTPSAGAIARIAAKRIPIADEMLTAVPTYIRPSEAEIKGQSAPRSDPRSR